jgi:excisionase family DNA binding protein
MLAKTRSGGLGEPLLTIKAVAQFLRCSTRTVRRLIDSRDLEVVRIGRSVRVRPKALQALIEGASDSKGQH